MAKRNKAKFASKARKSALRVEALEQRQLLATVSGSGVEVASNVSLNGNVFDQVVLTGASVTVQADPGQVVRVSFLDPQGDIVQTEFSGDGKFTVSLEDLKLLGGVGYNNANPAQTYLATVTGNDGKVHTAGSPIDYAQGLASIFIDNPEFNTNVSVFSAGLLTNFNFFNGQAKQGGNHYADIARIVIVGDPTNEAAYNNFGGIRAGNAIFGASSGVVGIRAENIAVQSTVIIGDIDASGSGIPTLVFHPLSQFVEVKVAGGDLVQTNGAAFNTSGNSISGLGGFDRFVSIDGARSDFSPIATKQANIDSGAYVLKSGLSQDVLNLSGRNQFVTMDGNWTYDLSTGKATQVLGAETNVFTFSGTGQTMLNRMFDERSFASDLTIIGGLGANLDINLGKVTGTLNIKGDVLGRVEVNGLFATIGALKIEGNLLGEVFVQGVDRSVGLGRDVFQNKIGSLTITGNMGSSSTSGAFVLAEQIGDVTIGGNLSGLISTDVGLDGAFSGVVLTGSSFTDYDGPIGNVSIAGDVVNGAVQGMTGLGNINVGGNITGAPSGTVAGVFATNSAQVNAATGLSASNLSIGKIGTLTVVGDVDLNSPSIFLINVAEEGNFGDVSIQGNGLLGRLDGNDFLNVGAIGISSGFGNASNTTGKITITDAKSVSGRGTDINFGGVQIGYGGTKAVGTLAAISIIGGGEDTDLVFSGSIGSTTLPFLGIAVPPNPAGDAIVVTSVTVTGFEDIVVNGNIQGKSVGPISLTPIDGVGSGDANDGTNTKVATSVTLNAGILADDGVPSQGETIGDLLINLKLTNSTVTLGAGFMYGTADVLKGTGSRVGNIALTANAITAAAGSVIFAETVGNTTLTAGGGNIAWGAAYNGLTIGNISATAASAVTVSGTIGSTGGVLVPFPLGLPADRTESVGNLTLTTSTNSNVTLSSTVNADVIGTTTLTGKDNTVTFSGNFLTAADAQSTATGAYGAITLSSSTKGAIAMGGSLSGAAGGDVTLTTLAGGNIGVTTTYLSGAGGKLTATLADGTITYNADVQGGSIGTATLTSTTKGPINYGALSTFAGTVGDVLISTKDVGTVTYGGGAIFGQNIALAQSGNMAVGTVTITAEKGAVVINPNYDDKVTAIGAITASTTDGTILYNAQTLGAGGAFTGQIIAGKETGSVGLVTLSTTGINATITVNADLEASSIAGITATTTGTTGSADITFANARFWAPTVGNFAMSTKEGNVSVDAASSFFGFTQSTSQSTSVGNTDMTAQTKGAVTFNGVIAATTNRNAVDNTGTMTVGNSTFTGNTVGGGVAFGGQIWVGKRDLMSAVGKFDGVIDQGTIGKITFNGNTALSALAQFGQESTEASAQALQNGLQQNGQFMPGASLIDSITVNGKLTAVGGTGTDGLIRASKLNSLTVTSDATLITDGSNTAAGLIFVPQLGQVTFGGAATSLTATAANAVFVTWNAVGFTFNATLTSLLGGTVIEALDATSALDTIGSIVSTGRVAGNAVVSGFNATPRGEIEASSIGNVTLASTLDGSGLINAVATDLDIRASNSRGNVATDIDGVLVGLQAGDYAITSELVATDGSNLASYTIGNISVTCIQDGTIDNNAVFSGLNTFIALGGLGNITLVGQPSGAVQPELFALATDAAWFAVGDGDSIGSAAQSRVDFNGNGKFAYAPIANPLGEVAEATSDFTGGTVNVGKIDLNVDNTGVVNAINEDVNKVGGTTLGPGDGFAVLVGVQADTAGVAAVGLGNGDGFAFSTHVGDRIDASLSGHVTSIRIQNATVSNQANVIAQAAAVVSTGSTAGFGGVIAVAGGGVVGVRIDDIINDVVPLGPVTLSDGQLAVLGNDPVTGVQDRWDANEILVYVI